MHMAVAVVTEVAVNFGGETHTPVTLMHGCTKVKLI